MSDQGKFHKLYLSTIDAYPNITKQQCQKDTNDIWQQIKRKERKYDEVMAQLQMRAQEHKLKMMKFKTNNVKQTISIRLFYIVSEYMY